MSPLRLLPLTLSLSLLAYGTTALSEEPAAAADVSSAVAPSPSADAPPADNTGSADTAAPADASSTSDTQEPDSGAASTTAEPEAGTETETEAEVERAELPERSEVAEVEIARVITDDEQQRLSDGHKEFLALWKPANASQAAGVVILVPGKGEHADWPKTIAPLRQRLPDNSWATLSLSLPDDPSDAPQARPADEPAPASSAADSSSEGQAADDIAAEVASSVQSGSTASNDASESAGMEEADYGSLVQARIQAGIDHAMARNLPTVVLLGHGSGAYWAAQYLKSNPNSGVVNLLLIAAQQPAEAGEPLPDTLKELKNVVSGDFYYKDKPADRNAARLRMNAAKQQAQPNYIQIAMKALPGNPKVEQEQLYRRVRGWLDLRLQATRATP